MNLADLKRMPVGAKLRIVHCLLGPVKVGKQLREVARRQSNALVFKGIDTDNQNMTESFLHFPRAAEFREDRNGFTILEDGEVAAQYEFVE